MSGGVVNSHQQVQLLVNYWEMRPSAMGARLDELLRHGVRRIVTFLPWQAVEADISHKLSRFLTAIDERGMSVSLIVTPEVGVHHPNSGLPKDMISRPEVVAQHFQNGPVVSWLPPNSFQLPTWFAPELTKRYYNFLSRVDSLLADIARVQPDVLERVTLVLSGSFWKYYRSPQASYRSIFGGVAGDYSGSAALAFRQCSEQFFSQREFIDSAPGISHRWKTRGMDEINRRWFYQQSEDVFRTRTLQSLRKKAYGVKIQELEIYTPEADPGFHYSAFLQAVSGRGSEFCRLSEMLDEVASRASLANSTATQPFIHWALVGGFKGLSDSERQFLILKSILLMGGQGGGILLDEADWFEMSPAFRARAEALSRSLANKELRLKNRALYLSSHLWSPAGTLWEELVRYAGRGARMVASVELVTQEKDATLAIVDPRMILTRETIQKLTAWAKGGRVLALPRSPLYTEAARAELERTVSQSKSMEIDLGVPYRLHSLGEGKLIVYDLPEGLAVRGEFLNAWQKFLTALLSIAEVQGYCRLSDARLSVIPLERKNGDLGLFVLNPTRRPVTADIIFPAEVIASDLAISLSGASEKTAPGVVPSDRYSLEVPACGILSLSISKPAPKVARPEPQAQQYPAGAEAAGEGLWK